MTRPGLVVTLAGLVGGWGGAGACGGDGARMTSDAVDAVDVTEADAAVDGTEDVAAEDMAVEDVAVEDAAVKDAAADAGTGEVLDDAVAVDAAPDDAVASGHPAVRVSAVALDLGSARVATVALPTAPASPARPAIARVGLVNVGDAPLAVTDLGVTGPGFALAADAAPVSLAPGARATVAVTFAPTALGPAAGELALATDDPARPEVRVALSGRGVDGTSRDVAALETQRTYGQSGVLLDVDRDGDLDLVVPHLAWPPALSPLAAFVNDGGALTLATAAVFGPVAPTAAHPRHFRVGDLDGDGHDDLFIADHGFDQAPFPGAVSHVLVQRDAGLVDESAARLPDEAAFTHDASIGDVDGDGDVDLYLANIYGQGQVPPRLLLNDGAGHFASADASALPDLLDYRKPGGRKYTASALVDVDLDGDLDLVLGGHGGTYPSERFAHDALLLNDGSGHFAVADDASLPARLGGDTAGTVGIEPADLDGDGLVDLVMMTHVDYRKGRLQLLVNAGDGTFRDVSERVVDDPREDDLGAPTAMHWITIAYPSDLDVDGRVDLVVVGAGMRHTLLAQDSEGRFVRTRVLDAANGAGAAPQWVVPGDMTGDGVPDLVLVSTRP